MEQYAQLCDYLAVVGAATVPGFVNDLVGTLTSTIGASDDQIKFLLEVFACFPIGLIWKAIPSPTLKHIFSILTSIWLCNFMVSYQWIHTVFFAVFTYLLLAILGPSKGRYAVFIFAFTYLSILHIYRMTNDYMGWKFDVTTQIMVFVQRVTAFAFNYYDGTVNPSPREMPDKGFFEKTNAVTKLPGLLPFLGWMFMPAVFPMGPFIEFNHFMKVVKKELVPPTSSFIPAMKCLLVGVFFLGVNQVGTPMFNILNLRSAEFLAANTPMYIYFYMVIGAFFLRTQYYFGFKIAEGAALVSGLGYAGLDAKGNPKWDACTGVDILSFETPTSYSMASAAWNIQTSVWLKRYVYFRAPRGNIALYSTYAVSAFWHGFYPGYYLFFITIAFATDVHRRIQVLISPYFDKPVLRQFYHVLSVLATLCTIHYFVAPFYVLDAALTWQLFSYMGFFIHYIVFGAFVILYIWGKIAPPARAPRAAPVATNADKTK
eukprot:TRINITY_DN17429_c0_g1_i1.p1 TRINITY_DN17429_c0_g1~~TRINITY_DN17429_c0_g1_i1.p1  ORF type:complete len:494 (-),score=105.35 TRINITY_DN17429_c0_g1_i1:39-1499(-)